MNRINGMPGRVEHETPLDPQEPAHEGERGPDQRHGAESGGMELPEEPHLRRGEVELTPQLNYRAVQRKPTAKEITEHSVTHLPYQGWCETCVAARAANDPHRRVSPVPDAEREAEVPKIYFDHAYFRTRRATPARQVLVAVCGTTGMRFTA